jgi:hypothetical protein
MQTPRSTENSEPPRIRSTELPLRSFELTFRKMRPYESSPELETDFDACITSAIVPKCHEKSVLLTSGMKQSAQRRRKDLRRTIVVYIKEGQDFSRSLLEQAFGSSRELHYCRCKTANLCFLALACNLSGVPSELPKASSSLAQANLDCESNARKGILGAANNYTCHWASRRGMQASTHAPSLHTAKTRQDGSIDPASWPLKVDEIDS